MVDAGCVPINDILMIAGMHGYLPNGEGGPWVPLARSLHDDPITTRDGGRVSTLIADPRAVQLGERFSGENLAVCFDNPATSGSYEQGRVRLIRSRSRGRDLIVDGHAQPEGIDGPDYAYIGPRVDRRVLGLIKESGIDTLMVTSGIGIQGENPNAVLMDLTLNSKRNDEELWRSIFETTLTNGLAIPSVQEFTVYAHADVTSKEAALLGLTGESEFETWEKIPKIAEMLRVERDVFTLYTKGFEVVTPLNADDLPEDIGDDGILKLPSLRSLSRRSLTSIA